MKTFSELKIGDDIYFYHYETQIIKFGKIVNIHYDNNYITFIYETILESPRYLHGFSIGKNAASKLDVCTICYNSSHTYKIATCIDDLLEDVGSQVPRIEPFRK